jgi:hypothetical protein
MTMGNTEACFVPTFLPSNMTDEEFIRQCEECLPKEFAARIVAAISNASDEVEEGLVSEVNDAVEKIAKAVPDESEIGAGGDETTLGDAGKALEAAREAFEAIRAQVKIIEERMSEYDQ